MLTPRPTRYGVNYILNLLAAVEDKEKGIKFYWKYGDLPSKDLKDVFILMTRAQL